MTRSYPGVSVTEHHEPFNLTFEEDTRYLLRIINVAYDSTFLFSIDNHQFTVISADFVPIKPYNTTSIAVGIGQRYNIIVDAKRIASNATDFWIRTHVLNGKNCHTGGPPPGPNYMQTGIIRYNESSRADPNTTQWSGLNTTYCRDEPAFTPVVEWKPKPPVNPGEPNRIIQFGGATDKTVVNPGLFSFITPAEFNANPQVRVPLRIDWQNITFLNLNNTGGWNNSFVILPEQYEEKEWVGSLSCYVPG
jgi:FtsP/CotA-like multicopper oxidase with cupredoxin domain